MASVVVGDDVGSTGGAFDDSADTLVISPPPLVAVVCPAGAVRVRDGTGSGGQLLAREEPLSAGQGLSGGTVCLGFGPELESDVRLRQARHRPGGAAVCAPGQEVVHGPARVVVVVFLGGIRHFQGIISGVHSREDNPIRRAGGQGVVGAVAGQECERGRKAAPGDG